MRVVLIVAALCVASSAVEARKECYEDWKKRFYLCEEGSEGATCRDTVENDYRRCNEMPEHVCASNLRPVMKQKFKDGQPIQVRACECPPGTVWDGGRCDPPVDNTAKSKAEPQPSATCDPRYSKC